jgi:hypothetical protein
LQGPKTDFDLFFKKGWQRQHVAEMADWMDREFQETYLPITRGNDVFRQARKKFEEQRYAEALQLFRQYINLVAGLREPRHLQVHNMQVWIGLCHSKLKQTDSAYLYYETAVRMAKEHLTPLRTEATRTDEDPLVSDLERLYDLSVASGRSRQAEQYRMLLDAETEKVMELSATPALHLITLAGSGGPSQTAAARLFHDRFSELKRSKTEGLIHYLSGSGTTRDQLDSLLESVRKRSKPEDILIFYYSGMISGEGNEGLLRFRESDTARGQLRLTDFLNRLDGIYARKKMLITDQPSPGLLGLIASRYVNLGRNSPELIYLSPGTITPLMPAGISLFTYQLTETLSELRKNDGFSAKDFVDKASYTLGRGQYYFPVLSFSFGKDFLLAENKKPVKVTVADPGADALRGVVVTNTADKQGQQASGPQRNHAVLVATDEYNDPGFKRLANPIYDAVTLGNLLREDFGFEVTLLKNPTLEELETTLGQFRDEKNYGPNDQLFLFFAGHGVYDERSKMGYLVAKDSREKDPNYKSYLSYSDLGNKYLKNIGCNRIFLVLDACFAGTFFESFGTRGSTDEANARMLESLKRRATNLHFYKGMSSGAKQYVEDGKSGQHSPFASALLTTLWTKGLSKNFVTADEIIADIKSKPPGNTDICEGRFQYSDPFSHFIFEMKNSGKESNIRTMNLK